MEPRDRAAEALRPAGPGSRLAPRVVAAGMVLVGIAFLQSPGLLVADTKFDLAESPLGFLARALHLWDTEGAFGQLQNQAYGYLWPMGPFFALGDVLGLPGWVVQRLWLALVMVVALVGVVLLARALGVRSDLACLVGGFAYALSPRLLSTLGPISIEAWPSAVAPWVLLPLVIGSRRGSPRRMALLAALAVAMVGGVNAAATFAVLPLGMVWLLTREPGPRRRSLMTWWPVFTLLATLWWLVPLFLLGAYSPPFLDFIETASVTTFPTTPFDVLRGTSDWVPYLDRTWQGGFVTVTTGYLALNSGLLLMLGLAGLMARRNPHRQFLVLSLLAGLLMVSLGHQGAVEGWGASVVHGQLDQALAPLRNVHKFDPVVRLPMVLGLAWCVQEAMASVHRARGRLRAVAAPSTAVLGLAVLGLLGTSLPAATGELTSTRPVFGTPDYWSQAATWLGRQDPDAVSLLAPGSSFASYVWGEPRDEPLQYLARSRWAVRNAVPLAPPGNIRMLDAVESRLAEGRGSPGLAGYLRRAGVRYLVVRNDLAPSDDVPQPVLVHQAIAASPGFSLARTFGPVVGGDAFLRRRDTRLVVDGGWQSRWRAIEVFEVEGAAAAAASPELPVVVGGPEDLLDLQDEGVLGDQPTRLAVDAPTGEAPDGPLVLTDGMLDRERFFGRVHDGYSAVRTPGDVARSGNPISDYRLGDGGTRWLTTARLDGAAALSASSSRADSDNPGGARPAELAYAAVDGDAATAWRSQPGASGSPWWRIDLDEPVDPARVRLTTREGDGVERVRVVTARGASDAVLLDPGSTTTVDVPAGETSWLRVEDAGGGSSGLALAEVTWPGRDVTRSLVLPSLPRSWGSPDTVVLRALRDARSGCAVVDGDTRCVQDRDVDSEEPTEMNRVVTLPRADTYQVRVTAVPRSGVELLAGLQRDLFLTATGSSEAVPDPRASGLAALDGDRGTAWTPDRTDLRPRLNVSWVGVRRLTALRARVDRDAPVQRPTELRLTWLGGARDVRLRPDGRADLSPPIRTDQLSVRAVAAKEAFSLDLDANASPLPTGISELRLRGLELDPLHLSTDVESWPCGTGPTLTVGGLPVRTRLLASRQALYSMQQVPAVPCRDRDTVRLEAGENVVAARAGRWSAPASVVLQRGAPSPSEAAATAGARFEGLERRLSPPAGSSYVTLRENANPGWRATQGNRAVSPVVVDGWQQGWATDGSDRPVQVRFPADVTYRLGLGAGLVALLVLLVLTVRRRRPGADLPAVGPAGVPPWVMTVVGVVAAGLLAGWPGLACLGVGLVATVLTPSRVRAALTWVAAGLLLVASSAYFLRPWGSGDGWAGASAWPHYLVLTALSVAVALAAGLRPRSLRRWQGSSTSR